MFILKNRTILGVACILMSLLVCFGLVPLFNYRINQKTNIIRVVKEIKTGSKINSDMVQTVEVGGYNLPMNAVRQKDKVIGKFVTADMFPGDFVLEEKISESTAMDNSYLYGLDGNRLAISITLKNFADGLSGKLQSGDIVSVIAPDYKKQGIAKIPVELQYVEIIASTASTGVDTGIGSDSDKAEDKKQIPSTVTLFATSEQAKILTEIEAQGSCRLSLVYRGSKENAKKYTDLQIEILNKISGEIPDKEVRNTGDVR